MSRLESFIARMQAQKVLLGSAAAELRAKGNRMPGPVIELGLGNGRTYDHLRSLLPDRRIIAFDHSLLANPKSMPPTKDLVLGDITETGPAFARRFGNVGALLHADLGNGVPDDDALLQQWLPDIVLALIRPGALAISSTELDNPALQVQHLPPGIAPGRYFSYRRR